MRLFKTFADIDAFPLVLDTKDTDEIVRTVEILAPSFGGINLEDISAPRCFEIEEKLKDGTLKIKDKKRVINPFGLITLLDFTSII